MLRQLTVALALVVLLGFAASLAQAGFVSSGLIFDIDARTDNNGADGWNFTEPTVPKSDALQVQGSAPTWTNAGGVQMFKTTGTSQSFAADYARISAVDVKDFTFQVGLIRYTDFNASSESQIASWRGDADFTYNDCRLYMPSGSQVAIDYRDRAGTRTQHTNIADIGSNTYHLLTLTYKDSTASGANNGQLTAYLDGTQTFQSTTEPLYMAGSGTAFVQCVSAFVVNWSGENYRNFDGGILFMNLYNRVLTGSELNQNLAEFNRISPEPGTLVLVSTGLLGLLAYAWRKRK
jgi:hypothetical protein